MYLAGIVTNGLYKCGDLELEISGMIPYLTHTVVVIIKIAVPILLIIFGMIDLGKAVVAAKEDEIKKGQQTFVKRAVTAVIVFFVVYLVQLIINFVSSKESSVANCFNCFVNGIVDEEKNTGCIPIYEPEEE